jgi:hypothetical protein
MAIDLVKKIQARAKQWGTEITQQANRNLGNKAKLIAVRSKTVSDGSTVSIVSSGIAKDKDKPVARAYEYGSGTRSRVKRKSPKQLSSGGKILIRPKSKRVLAFFWDKITDPPGTVYYNKATGQGSKKLIKVSDHPDHKGKILMRYVEHPGVNAANGGKGYLLPAVRKIRPKIRKELLEIGGTEIFKVVRRAFR